MLNYDTCRTTLTFIAALVLCCTAYAIIARASLLVRPEHTGEMILAEDHLQTAAHSEDVMKFPCNLAILFGFAIHDEKVTRGLYCEDAGQYREVKWRLGLGLPALLALQPIQSTGQRKSEKL
ncbi:unnamed protein product [Diplocarpon coronariae]|nr:hypothetical protein JHW43_005931 [Diplocarpon mali]